MKARRGVVSVALARWPPALNQITQLEASCP